MSLDPLNEKEINLLIDYGLKWTKIGLSTAQINLDRAVKAIIQLCRLSGAPIPSIFLGPFPTPLDCAYAQAVVKRLEENVDITTVDIFGKSKTTKFTDKEIQECLNEQMYASLEAHWLGGFDYLNKIENNCLPEIQGMLNTAKECFAFAAYDKVVFIQERPLEIHLNAAGELHNAKGPALKWRSEDRSLDVYALNGKVVAPFN